MQLTHRTINLTIAFSLLATYLVVVAIPEFQKDRTHPQAISVVEGRDTTP